jgi:glycosyltransferase involved in cell wall biosynthesis
MRILEVAPFASPIDERRAQLGGAQVLIADLARSLAARGHEVTLAAAEGSYVSGVALAPLGVDSERLRRADLAPSDVPRSDEPLQRAAFARVGSWIGANAAGIDVAHAHAYDAPAFEELADAARPVVHTLHLPPLDATVVRAARAAARATLVTVSRANARAWTAAGVPVPHVIPNGVDTASIPFGSGGTGHLLYAGRISPEKGVDAAIEVAEAVGRGLVLVGAAYDESYFARLIAPRVRAVDHVEAGAPLRGAVYVGPQPRAVVHQLMRDAAATLMPVRWDEPFGLVALESLAAGTPVVAYRRGGLPEVIDISCGELVAPDDQEAFARAIGPAVAKDRRACRRRAERFRLEAMVAAYEGLLEQVAAGGRGATR